MAFDYWTKFTGSRNRDIYPPSRRSRAVPRDPATLVIEFYIPSSNNFNIAKNLDSKNICRIIAYKVPY
jgi:hypothetical protein